jgi:hypothetical protein
MNALQFAELAHADAAKERKEQYDKNNTGLAIPRQRGMSGIPLLWEPGSGIRVEMSGI